MEKQFLIAGFGGQGVLLIGQLIAKAAMRQGYEVSWMPSYGPEMRGGEANCAVVVSDEPIGSPLVSEPPVLVAMNKPSLMKFMPMMPAGGTLLYNASLIEGVELRTDVTVIPVACNEVAEQLGNGRVSNMVMLGAIQAATEVVTDDNLGSDPARLAGREKSPPARHQPQSHRSGPRHRVTPRGAWAASPGRPWEAERRPARRLEKEPYMLGPAVFAGPLNDKKPGIAGLFVVWYALRGRYSS